MESVLLLIVRQNWNLHHVTFLAPSIWSWLLRFWEKFVGPRALFIV